MRVVEIFKSIDGEGIRAGLPTTFIRLFGCNLHCSYCDTRYGCEGNDYITMSVREIVEECHRLEVESITITGGEPLIHEGIESLIEQLLFDGFWVNIETNGTIDPYKFVQKSLACKYLGDGNLFFTMDYKSPSSGMNDKMDLANFRSLKRYDVLKFVVGSYEDLDKAIGVLDELKTTANVYFSPVFGEIEPKTIVEYILQHKLYDCKVQLQMHKVIWPVDKRGV